DLAEVPGCDGRLFDLLARTQRLLGCRGGWLRLVGLGPPVLDALDQAALPEVLLVYKAARHDPGGERAQRELGPRLASMLVTVVRLQWLGGRRPTPGRCRAVRTVTVPCREGPY